VPFGAERTKRDSYTVETTRNYNAGTRIGVQAEHFSASQGAEQAGSSAQNGTRTRTRTNTNPNDTEANAADKSGNARALRKQRKMAQQKSRIHFAKPKTLKFSGAEQETSGVSGAEPRLRAALADLEEMWCLQLPHVS